ncbi:MAG: alpha/beta hydrolase [Actinomycetota bacterium]|nr:alpha/beta hydrolase [Actinomycetota bacterium]
MTETTDGVLLIHAFPMDASMWEAQVDDLRERWPVVAPNLPGFGGAADAGDVMTMRAAADTCVRALDDAGIERVVVCGLSMGGYVAFELWRSARSRIAGLVLANTKAGADTPESAAVRRSLAARLRAEGNDFLVADPPPLLGHRASEELWERVKGTIAAQPAAAIAAAAEGMAGRADSTADLDTIDVPTLVLTSEGDTLITPDVSLFMAAHIDGADSQILEGAGHLSNMEAPEAFSEALRAFLGRFRRD